MGDDAARVVKYEQHFINNKPIGRIKYAPN